MRRIGSYKDSGAVMEWKIESSSLKRNFNSIVSMEIRSNVDLSTKLWPNVSPWYWFWRNCEVRVRLERQ